MNRAIVGFAAGLALVTLSACASTPAPPPEPAWSGGDPAHLTADKVQCRKEVEGLDVNVSAGYSDPRYGVTSAMAAAVGRDNPLADRAQIVRDAAFVTCMTDKGWKAQ
ncbi:MAG TPA: hypothetical protein VGI79_14960 [Caulobacteraceae bacterium]|jgi:hypothetical protein